MLFQIIAYLLQIIRRLQGSSEPASGLEYPLDTRANLFVVDELTPLDLVEANLYLLPEQVVIGEQPVHSFPDQLVGSPACFRRHLVELSFLIWRELDFHPLSVRVEAG